MKYCSCFKRRTVSDAIRDIADEVAEFVAQPSRDELSDICFGIGRLLGSLVGREYVRFMGDGAHVAKINKRMSDYGCIRSRNHFVQH